MAVPENLKEIDFSLRTYDGLEFKLARALRESPVLLVFFKHDCPTCQFTMPFIERLHKRFENGELQVFGVAQDEPGKAVQFISEYGISFPVLVDNKPYVASRKFDFNVVPTTILLDENGNRITQFMGFQKDELEKLNYILAGIKHSPEPVFTAQDDVPAVKPG